MILADPKQVKIHRVVKSDIFKKMHLELALKV